MPGSLLKSLKRYAELNPISSKPASLMSPNLRKIGTPFHTQKNQENVGTVPYNHGKMFKTIKDDLIETSKPSGSQLRKTLQRSTD